MKTLIFDVCQNNCVVILNVEVKRPFLPGDDTVKITAITSAISYFGK